MSKPLVVDTVNKSGKTLVVSGEMDLLFAISEQMLDKPAFHGRELRVPTSRRAIEVLLEYKPDRWTGTAQKELDAVKEVIARERETLLNRNKQVESVDGYEFGGVHPPYDHQRSAFAVSRDLPYFGLFMEAGTGKSRVIIDNGTYLYRKGEIDILLILAPNGVHRQWITEQLPEHMPDEEYQACYEWYRNPGRKIPDDVFTREGFRVLSLNLDVGSNAKGQTLVEDIIASSTVGVMIVIDESSRIKNSQSKRTKFFTRAAKKCKYRRILTGTPITQGYHDLYGQMTFLSEDILGCRSLTAFRNRYCRMGGFENRAVIGYNNLDELTARMKGHTFQARKDDCLDLPTRMPPVRVEVDMTPEQERLYKQMREDYFMELDSGALIDGQIAAVRLMRMHQVLCGHAPRTDDDPWYPIKNNRIQACKDILEGVDGKTIIWCRWTPDVEQMLEAIPGSLGYAGGHSQAERAKNLDLFRESDDHNVLVMQIQTGGIGLNITEAVNNIYYSNHFSLELRLQSMDRTYRAGQTKHVSYFDIVVPKTIDDSILKALRAKKEIADAVLDRAVVDGLI